MVPIHSNKCLPNFGILKLIVGSIKMRYAIFQKQIMNRVHTIFSHWMIQKTDKNHQLDYLSERSYYVIFHNLLKISSFLLSWYINHIFSHKYMFTCCYPADKHLSPERPEEVPSNVARTSPKHPIWPSGGRYHLTIWGRLDLTSQRRSESTSQGRTLVGVLKRSQYLQRTS